jgi:hypothetical protein
MRALAGGGGSVRARAHRPGAAVAGVAVEVDHDAVGGVLDRNDVGWTEKEDGAALLAVHREHWSSPSSSLALRGWIVLAAMVGWQFTNRSSPAFQRWPIRTNPVMIIFDHER